jgi:hypothetical protein
MVTVHNLQVTLGKFNVVPTGWTIGVLGLDSRRGLGIFLFITASETTLEPPSLLSNGYRGFSPGVKQPEREFNHSPPTSVEVNTSSWHGA